jgi:hypothetical protein
MLLTRGDGSVREAGEKCFQVREHATREWRLHTEVALQDGADTTLTGGELCLQLWRKQPFLNWGESNVSL